MKIKRNLIFLILSTLMLEATPKPETGEDPQGFSFPLESLSETDYRIIRGDKDSSGGSNSCGACGS